MTLRLIQPLPLACPICLDVGHPIAFAAALSALPGSWTAAPFLVPHRQQCSLARSQHPAGPPLLFPRSTRYRWAFALIRCCLISVFLDVCRAKAAPSSATRLIAEAWVRLRLPGCCAALRLVHLIGRHLRFKLFQLLQALLCPALRREQHPLVGGDVILRQASA